MASHHKADAVTAEEAILPFSENACHKGAESPGDKDKGAKDRVLGAVLQKRKYVKRTSGVQVKTEGDEVAPDTKSRLKAAAAKRVSAKATARVTSQPAIARKSLLPTQERKLYWNPERVEARKVASRSLVYGVDGECLAGPLLTTWCKLYTEDGEPWKGDKHFGASLNKTKLFSDTDAKDQVSKSCHHCQAQHIYVICCDTDCIKSFCDKCHENHFPDLTRADIVRKCPFCRGCCNCKTCLRTESKLTAVSSYPEDLHRVCSEYALSHMAEPVRQLLEQEDTLAKALGYNSVEKVPYVSMDRDRVVCDVCATSIANMHTTCTECRADFCVDCCLKAAKNITPSQAEVAGPRSSETETQAKATRGRATAEPAGGKAVAGGLLGQAAAEGKATAEPAGGKAGGRQGGWWPGLLGGLFSRAPAGGRTTAELPSGKNTAEPPSGKAGGRPAGRKATVGGPLGQDTAGVLATAELPSGKAVRRPATGRPTDESTAMDVDLPGPDISAAANGDGHQTSPRPWSEPAAVEGASARGVEEPVAVEADVDVLEGKLPTKEDSLYAFNLIHTDCLHCANLPLALHCAPPLSILAGIRGGKLPSKEDSSWSTNFEVKEGKVLYKEDTSWSSLFEAEQGKLLSKEDTSWSSLLAWAGKQPPKDEDKHASDPSGALILSETGSPVDMPRMSAACPPGKSYVRDGMIWLWGHWIPLWPPSTAAAEPQPLQGTSTKSTASAADPSAASTSAAGTSTTAAAAGGGMSDVARPPDVGDALVDADENDFLFCPHAVSLETDHTDYPKCLAIFQGRWQARQPILVRGVRGKVRWDSDVVQRA
eukprot:gene14387-20389_t